jgi:hypothetical protein
MRRSPAAVALVLAGLTAVLPASGLAQWSYPTPGIPRLPDGKPDLNAPAPRTADGKPDISGLWMPSGPYVENVAGTAGPGDIPFQPWAAELYRQRLLDTLGRDDPSARCIPAGVPRANLIAYPFRIIPAAGRVVIIYEIFSMWREIFTDGRELPEDPTPTWMGYSTGHWEGSEFVVRSSGFNGKAWVDTEGRPTTDALHVTERFLRKDFGRMELKIIVDDPKAYTRPWSIMVPLTYYADFELMEYACNENNRYSELLPDRND